MTGQGAGLDGAALDAAAAAGPKVGHIEVGHLADLDQGQGVEAAALTARRSTSGAAGPALADLDGAALLQDQGAAVGQVQPVEGLDHGGGRVERARSTTARPDSYCAHCGRRMSPGRHGRRRYCSNGCRQSAYKRRRRAAAAVEGVKDGN